MLDTRQANAIRKAVELDGAARVRRLEFGTYLVESATREGLTHVVTGTRMDGADLECDCESGSLGRACWHKGAVYVRRLQENAGVRVIGPAPAAAPAALPTPRASLRRVELV